MVKNHRCSFYRLRNKFKSCIGVLHFVNWNEWNTKILILRFRVVLLNAHFWLHAVSRVCLYVNQSQLGLKMYVWNPIEIKEREKRSFNSRPSFTFNDNNMLTLQALYWKDSSTHAYSSCFYIVTLSIYLANHTRSD